MSTQGHTARVHPAASYEARNDRGGDRLVFQPRFSFQLRILRMQECFEPTSPKTICAQDRPSFRSFRMSEATDSYKPRRHSQFRPCIDLHGGVVKQIVGGTLGTDDSKLKTNFVAT